jgi:hypothetical protein
VRGLLGLGRVDRLPAHVVVIQCASTLPPVIRCFAWHGLAPPYPSIPSNQSLTAERPSTSAMVLGETCLFKWACKG